MKRQQPVKLSGAVELLLPLQQILRVRCNLQSLVQSCLGALFVPHPNFSIVESSPTLRPIRLKLSAPWRILRVLSSWLYCLLDLTYRGCGLEVAKLWKACGYVAVDLGHDIICRRRGLSFVCNVQSIQASLIVDNGTFVVGLLEAVVPMSSFSVCCVSQVTFEVPKLKFENNRNGDKRWRTRLGRFTSLCSTTSIYKAFHFLQSCWGLYFHQDSYLISIQWSQPFTYVLLCSRV